VVPGHPVTVPVEDPVLPLCASFMKNKNVLLPLRKIVGKPLISKAPISQKNTFLSELVGA
jgi:hypothetical protein